MAKKSQLKSSTKSIEALTHNEAKRKNIPTAEYQSVIQKEEEKPKSIKYPRNTDLDPQLVWRGKDEQDWSDLVVHAPPLYIQEKVHPKVLIDDLLRQTRAQRDQEAGAQADLFADFNGMPAGIDKTEFYQHDQNWSNRMILGDSLQVMASLAEREGLRGKVQCIYIDPPYGIKFNSNFQWSTTSRDVKDGNAGHITREPEQVKAFRDTWRDGIHSYLTYLRDRLTVARDLLTESGSLFVQIGDENVHRVRAMMDEVFGETNFAAQIAFLKTSAVSSPEAMTNVIGDLFDYVVWYAKDLSRVKYRQPMRTKEFGGKSEYKRIALADGTRRSLSSDDEVEGGLEELSAARFYRQDNIISTGYSESLSVPFRAFGTSYQPNASSHWKTTIAGMERLLKAARLEPRGKQLSYVRFFDDFSVTPIGNFWEDVLLSSRAEEKVYVVQTSSKVIQRCILMTTDPGDLVLDPTCGSGTTATVAEQWGRRWITIDTSRVALALARARIMGARYPFYLLADSREGQFKEAEVTRTAPSSQPVQGNIRHGFVYERVPHITLKSIANNAEIDVIWDKGQQALEPLREKLNEALGTNWQEWEIPRELQVSHAEARSTRRVDAKVVDSSSSSANSATPREIPSSAKKLHADWWQARLARQKEIDASIAAKAEFEYLYDKPYADNKKVRVAGPFTVEGLSPHRVLGVDENDELIDSLKEPSGDYGSKQSFPQMILENLKTAGVQQAHKEDKITFTSLTAWPGELVCGEGRYLKGSDPSPSGRGNGEGVVERRAAIFIGPEFGTVQRADLVAAAREAGDAGFDVLIACAFN
jgi:adenine-specific DNA-methyltransferase